MRFLNPVSVDISPVQLNNCLKPLETKPKITDENTKQDWNFRSGLTGQKRWSKIALYLCQEALIT